MNYATTVELRNYAKQFMSEDETAHEIMLEAASRIIDKLCVLPDDYFAAATERLSERTFTGRGTRRLRLTPYVGKVRYVDYEDGDAFPPDFVEVTDENGAQWLRARCGVWADEASVIVRAQWGMRETPAEIVHATIELAVLLWRTSDPTKVKIMTDVNGQLIEEKAIPQRVREICAAWRKRREVVIL